MQAKVRDKRENSKSFNLQLFSNKKKNNNKQKKKTRFSVERLFYDLMKSGHPALDPLVITPDGLLTIRDEVLESPQLLCTMLQGHR